MIFNPVFISITLNSQAKVVGEEGGREERELGAELGKVEVGHDERWERGTEMRG